jgi:hypothetical protein
MHTQPIPYRLSDGSVQISVIIDTSRSCSHFALFSSNDVGNCIGGNPEFAKMGHPKGLTDKAVTDMLINSDSQEGFGSDINDE